MFRKLCHRILPDYAVEILKIKLQDFNILPIILVYQMGKVGSATVVHSLRNSHLPNPVFHAHFLNRESILSAEAFHRERSKKKIPAHLRISKTLHKKMKTEMDVKWKIITLVREPIAWLVSDFFENAHLYYGTLLDEHGQIKNDEAVGFLQKRIIDNYNEQVHYMRTWFDKEIKTVFNMDVHIHPFNHHDGFSIIRRNNCDLLVLRLEDLNKNFNIAINRLMDSNTIFKMQRTNIAMDKAYSDSYQYVLNNMRIPKNDCLKIYSSKFVRHFYNQKMIDSFIEKWSAGDEGTISHQ